MDIQLIQYMQERLKNTNSKFKRYLYPLVNWDRQMKGIVGPRGVGKTTMMLQYIKEHQEDKSLYVSADNIYFSNHTLIETIDDFVKEGGLHIFIDEIHKYSKWSQELKQIYDTHPTLKVTFTGSSVLDIIKGEADLSRRAVIYNLQGLSFREYLQLFHNIKTEIYSLDDILQNKVKLEELEHPLPLFKDYLKHGYYPFGNDPDFNYILNQIITQTMESDIPQFAEMNVSTGRKLKQLLAIVAKSVPFKPVMESLANIIRTSRNSLPDYFMYMEKAGVISQLRDSTGGIRGLGKIEKVYLDNTNLIYALGGNDSDIGNIRETFFNNQMRVNNDIISSRISDFEISDKTFEIGGKKKGKKQIAEAREGYIVKDDIEYGYSNVIPLWSFGLNY